MPKTCKNCNFALPINDEFIDCGYWEIQKVPIIYGCNREEWEKSHLETKRWYQDQLVFNRVRYKNYKKNKQKYPRLFGEKGIINKQHIKEDKELKKIIEKQINNTKEQYKQKINKLF